MRMGGYADFAAFYDRLTDDVGYPQRAEYIAGLLAEHGVQTGMVLDLACGTGSLTLELSRRGYEMIGVDASPDMLCAAQEKCAQAGAEVLFLCQPMEALNLYGTVNAAVCTLDSLNHITDPDTLREVFRRVARLENYLYLPCIGSWAWAGACSRKRSVISGKSGYPL